MTSNWRLQLQQIGDVLDLGDAARSDHTHLDALHRQPLT